MSFDRDDIEFHVVVNDEEQYSIWPDFKPTPAGWYRVGVRGSKAVCLAHIETVWTDMRTRSLRNAMDGSSDGRAA
ncbi:MbtH family protein [Arboricoccus pini]|nr:MbtH family NRPS accessory protein [Arboricoccus pini]